MGISDTSSNKIWAHWLNTLLRFTELSKWEIENTFRPPMAEILLGLIILLTATSPPLYVRSVSVESLTGAVAFIGSLLDNWLFIYFFVFSVPLAISIGGVFETGEIRVLLSYPIKRWEILISKLVVNSVVLFLMSTIPVSFHLFLDIPITYLIIPEVQTSILLLFFSLYLRILFVCTITTFFAVISRNSKIAIFASFTTLFLLAAFISLLPEPYSFFVNFGQIGLILIAFNGWLWSENPPSFFMFPGPILFLLFSSIVFLIIILLYFLHMDVT